MFNDDKSQRKAFRPAFVYLAVEESQNWKVKGEKWQMYSETWRNQ